MDLKLMPKIIGFIYREKSAVSQSITWRHPLAVKKAEIDGATAFAVAG